MTIYDTPTTREECVTALERVYDILEGVKCAVPDDLMSDMEFLLKMTDELTDAIRDWESAEEIAAERKAFEAWLWTQVM